MIHTDGTPTIANSRAAVDTAYDVVIRVPFYTEEQAQSALPKIKEALGEYQTLGPYGVNEPRVEQVEIDHANPYHYDTHAA